MLAHAIPQPTQTTTHSIDAFTLAEQQRIVAAARESDIINALGIALCFYTGIRLGELCGLHWQDIDLSAGTIHIKRTMQRIANTQSDSETTGSAKTRMATLDYNGQAPERTLHLPQFVTTLLQKYQPITNDTVCELEPLPAQDAVPVATYVISRQGEPIEPRNMQYRFKALQKRAEVSPRKFHAIRHTFAVRAIESGCDLHTLSELLGHTSLQMTEKHYAHVARQARRWGMDAMVESMEVG